MDINIYNLSIIKIADSAFMALYLCFIIILAGIDKENRKIEKSVSYFGIAISIMYIVYLCTIQNVSVYRYIMYLVLYIIVLILDTITLRRYAKSSYLNGIIFTVITMCIFTGEYVARNTIILTLLSISFYILIYKLRNLKNRNKKTDKQVGKTISIGFYLGVANIINILLTLVYYNLC